MLRAHLNYRVGSSLGQLNETCLKIELIEGKE